MAHIRKEGELFEPGFNITETDIALYIYWAEEGEFIDPFGSKHRSNIPRYELRIPKGKLETHGMWTLDYDGGVEWLRT